MIADCQPDSLNRCFDGPQDLNNAEIIQFGQDAINACRTKDKTTMYPRLTLNIYKQSRAQFQAAVQNLFQLGQKFNPVQTGIALDNEDAISTYDEALDAIGICRSAGFTDVCFGAIGSKFIGEWKSGDVDFVMLGVNTTTWLPDEKLIKYWQQFSSVKHIIYQIDPPLEYLQFAKLSIPDKFAALTSLSEEQAKVNAAFMYLVDQQNFDSLTEGTYYFMKGLMAQNN